MQNTTRVTITRRQPYLSFHLYLETLCHFKSWDNKLLGGLNVSLREELEVLFRLLCMRICSLSAIVNCLICLQQDVASCVKGLIV
jgi:hypothetical protein